MELFCQQLEYTLLSLVLQVQHVDNDDIDLLPIPMAATDTLLDALRIPWQVKIDEQRAELQVDALGAALGSDEDGLFRAFERFDNGRLHVGTLRPGTVGFVGVAGLPLFVDLLAKRI